MSDGVDILVPIKGKCTTMDKIHSTFKANIVLENVKFWLIEKKCS